ncbi:type II toxin-antitoxin system PemK/MazF family toxin [Blastococcus sp. SYSU DS0539]
MAAAARPVRTVVRAVGRVLGTLRRAPRAARAPRARRARATGRGTSSARPAPDVSYAPHDDDRPDPGEVVWAWVPFEEDDGRGKDRPVLVIGRRGDELLGLMLSSQDHDRDAEEEARHGRRWIDVGTGAWDPRGRPSEVRLDRLLVLDPAMVRREGAALDRVRFERVVGEARRVQGW